MSIFARILSMSLISAFFCVSANAYVSVRIGPPVIYSAPTYSYGCGHVGEPPCSYPNTYYGTYGYPSVAFPLSGIYFDPWYYYDRGPGYRHHHHHGYAPRPHGGYHHGYTPRHGGPGHMPPRYGGYHSHSIDHAPSQRGGFGSAMPRHHGGGFGRGHHR